MPGYWARALGNQYSTSIEFLRRSIELCPDDLWDDRSQGTPVWHLAYHTLFFCDLYLSKDLNEFRPRDYHVDHYHFLPGEYGEFGGRVATPEWNYSKQQMLEYAEHCARKCSGVFESLTEECARERCGFWWYDLDVGEFLLNSLRHTQHHAGQIALILRRQAGIGVEWLGTNAGSQTST